VFSFVHVGFEMSPRHPSEAVKKASEYIYSEFRIKVKTKDINISVYQPTDGI
jgi:hypothetical protein